MSEHVEPSPTSNGKPQGFCRGGLPQGAQIGMGERLGCRWAWFLLNFQKQLTDQCSSSKEGGMASLGHWEVWENNVGFCSNCGC